MGPNVFDKEDSTYTLLKVIRELLRQTEDEIEYHQTKSSAKNSIYELVLSGN